MDEMDDDHGDDREDGGMDDFGARLTAIALELAQGEAEAAARAVKADITTKLDDMATELRWQGKVALDVLARVRAAEDVAETLRHSRASQFYEAARASNDHAAIATERAEAALTAASQEMGELRAVFGDMAARYAAALDAIAAMQIVVDALPETTKATTDAALSSDLARLADLANQTIADSIASNAYAASNMESRVEAVIEMVKAQAARSQLAIASYDAKTAEADGAIAKHAAYAAMREAEAEEKVTKAKDAFAKSREAFAADIATGALNRAEIEASLADIIGRVAKAEAKLVHHGESGITLSGFAGEWQATKTYPPGSVVTYQNTTWVSVRTTSATPGASTDWQVMAGGSAGFTNSRQRSGAQSPPPYFFQDTAPLATPNNWASAGAKGHVRLWIDTNTYAMHGAVTDAGGNWIWLEMRGFGSTATGLSPIPIPPPTPLQAGFYLRINSAGTAYEFTDSISGGTF